MEQSVPREPAARQQMVEDFIARVDKCQIFGEQDVPVILHFDERKGSMRPWGWPTVRKIPVRPEDLDRHRYTHHFKAPTCPCAFKDGSSISSETKIGLAPVVVQPGHSHVRHEYVAICSLQQCGYFVRLEPYFRHPKLVTQQYLKRPKVLTSKDLNPFFFFTDDTEETISKTGFRQVHILRDDSNTGLRGTNRLLKRENPEQYLKLQDMLKRLVVKGLSADNFWDLFVQCTDCRFVMPCHYFPYYHQCVVQVVHRQLGLPKALPPPNGLDDMIDDLLENGEEPDTASFEVLLPWVDPNAAPMTPDRHSRRP